MITATALKRHQRSACYCGRPSSEFCSPTSTGSDKNEKCSFTQRFAVFSKLSDLCLILYFPSGLLDVVTTTVSVFNSMSVLHIITDSEVEGLTSHIQISCVSLLFDCRTTRMLSTTDLMSYRPSPRRAVSRCSVRLLVVAGGRTSLPMDARRHWLSHVAPCGRRSSLVVARRPVWWHTAPGGRTSLPMDVRRPRKSHVTPCGHTTLPTAARRPWRLHVAPCGHQP